jgi:predicted dinucleotide-binding enzyme
MNWRPSQRRTVVKVGILGTGPVGQALGDGFVAVGHDVMMGSRDPNNERAETWAEVTGSTRSETWQT